MALFDKIKGASKNAGKAVQTKYHEQQEKSAQLADMRGKRLTVLQVEYAGGYGDYPPTKIKGALTFYEKCIEFKVPLYSKKSFGIEASQISDVAIEGRHEANSRVTVTRLLAVGIFAFALKKKQEEKEAFITVELADGQEVVFRAEGKSPLQLKASLADTVSRVKQNTKQVSSLAQTSNVADELSKLVLLKKQGVLSEAEFAAQKRRLLG